LDKHIDAKPRRVLEGLTSVARNNRIESVYIECSSLGLSPPWSSGLGGMRACILPGVATPMIRHAHELAEAVEWLQGELESALFVWGPSLSMFAFPPLH